MQNASFIGRLSLCLACAIIWIGLTHAAVGQPKEGPSRPADQFTSVNGVKLHFLDWGGKGDVLLFLPGLGDSVHRFDGFAPSFVDHFRVLGLTRRGQGQSEQPSSGYDTRTLVEDIREFLNRFKIARVTLIGHSIAGVEMTKFAELYPDRLAKLVYLDAGMDGARGRDAAARANLPRPEFPSDAIAAIDREASQTSLAAIRVPALAFFVLYDSFPDDPNWDEKTRKWTLEAFRVYEPLKRQTIDEFKSQVRRGRVIELHDTNHFFFLDPKRTAQVIREIRQFLLD